MSVPANSISSLQHDLARRLDAWAVTLGYGDHYLGDLLSEETLRLLGPAYKRDTPIPAEALPKHFRFHARRWIVNRVQWAPGQAARPLPSEVESIIHERCPDRIENITGFISSDDRRGD